MKTVSDGENDMSSKGNASVATKEVEDASKTRKAVKVNKAGATEGSEIEQLHVSAAEPAPQAPFAAKAKKSKDLLSFLNEPPFWKPITLIRRGGVPTKPVPESSTLRNSKGAGGASGNAGTTDAGQDEEAN